MPITCSIPTRRIKFIVFFTRLVNNGSIKINKYLSAVSFFLLLYYIAYLYEIRGLFLHNIYTQLLFCM